LIDANTNLGVEGAEVSLYQDNRRVAFTPTKKDGRYCIRYEGGKEITTLKFDKGKLATVLSISGNYNHYINKLINLNTPMTAQAHVVPTKTMARRIGPRAANAFIAVQVVLTNVSSQSLQVLSFHFEHPSDISKGTAETDQNKVSTTMAADIQSVVSAASPRSLLRVGRVELLSIASGGSHHTCSDIYEQALRLNEVIPSNSSISRIVFVDRDELPRNVSRDPIGVLAALGELVIQANRLTIEGDAKLSAGLADATTGTVPLVAHSVSGLSNGENSSLAVASVIRISLQGE